jgi:hypothetical protein
MQRRNVATLLYYLHNDAMVPQLRTVTIGRYYVKTVLFDPNLLLFGMMPETQRLQLIAKCLSLFGNLFNIREVEIIPNVDYITDNKQLLLAYVNIKYFNQKIVTFGQFSLMGKQRV